MGWSWGYCDIAVGMMWECCGMLLEFPVVLLGIAVILRWHDCGIPVIAGWIACCGLVRDFCDCYDIAVECCGIAAVLMWDSCGIYG